MFGLAGLTLIVFIGGFAVLYGLETWNWKHVLIGLGILGWVAFRLFDDDQIRLLE